MNREKKKPIYKIKQGLKKLDEFCFIIFETVPFI